ncbi:MAG: hypothetical protein EXR46_03545, partial [Dehalococcoidia bacterium]|nr:hypothetical protein [Dehalococcoidia bacterium]
MKRKLVTYFPLAVLALGLTLGMAAAFMALRPSSGVPTIDAAHTTHSTQSFTVTQSPATVGELSEYVFTFSVTGTVAGIGAALMPANVAEIRLTFDDSAQLPASIPANAVLVQASFLTNVAEITTGLACADTSANAAYHSAGGADMAVELSMSPTFDVDITDSARKIVIIKVPDMNPTTGTGSCGAGAQGIASGARVIVTFTTSAGIKNRTEATTSGDYDIQACSAACVSPATTNVVTGHSSGALVTVANVTTKAKLTLSSINGARGSTVTAVAKGLKDGQTATFWLDRDTMDMNCDGDKTDTLTSRDETDIGGS